MDDDSYVSRGPLQASTEVELVSFGDPDPLAPPEDIRMDAELEELVLGRLCGLLHATLTDGLEQPLLGGLFQGGVRTGWSIFEAWARVIEARCESDMGENERAKPSVCLIGLCKAVLRVAQLYDDEGPSVKAQFPPAGEFKLRALICYGLKCVRTTPAIPCGQDRASPCAPAPHTVFHPHHACFLCARAMPRAPRRSRSVGELHEWFSMLALDGPVEQIYDWYQPNAFVHMRETMLMMAEQLVPLTAHPFRLPLQLECRTITRDSAVYGFSPSQPAHSWL